MQAPIGPTERSERAAGLFQWLDAVAAFFALLGGLVAAFVAALIVASIIGRAVWARPIPGDVELTQLGIAISIAMCLPWAQTTRSNIIVDFFTQALRERTQRRLDAAGALLVAVMTGVLAWRSGAGAIAVQQSFETTMILALPMWWTYAALAPGLVLTSLIALVQASRLAFGGQFNHTENSH